MAAIRSALNEGGRFAFETRNPLARAWEQWEEQYTGQVTDGGGAVVRREHRVETPVEGDVVRFTTTYTSPGWDRPRTSHGMLRFLGVDSLSSFLSEAGLEIVQQFGDWSRLPLTDTSPEIITIARRG